MLFSRYAFFGDNTVVLGRGVESPVGWGEPLQVDRLFTEQIFQTKTKQFSVTRLGTACGVGGVLA